MLAVLLAVQVDQTALRWRGSARLPDNGGDGGGDADEEDGEDDGADMNADREDDRFAVVLVG